MNEGEGADRNSTYATYVRIARSTLVQAIISYHIELAYSTLPALSVVSMSDDIKCRRLGYACQVRMYRGHEV